MERLDELMRFCGVCRLNFCTVTAWERWQAAQKQPAPPSPAESTSYRLLETGEIIQEGDEWQDGEGCWRNATALGIGRTPKITENQWRRPITGGAGLHEAATVSQEPPSSPKLRAVLAAAENLGSTRRSPCFHVTSEDGPFFCEAPEYAHKDTDHPFVSLATLIGAVASMAQPAPPSERLLSAEDALQIGDFVRANTAGGGQRPIPPSWFGRSPADYPAPVFRPTDKCSSLRLETSERMAATFSAPSEQAVRDDLNGNPPPEPRCVCCTAAATHRRGGEEAAFACAHHAAELNRITSGQYRFLPMAVPPFESSDADDFPGADSDPLVFGIMARVEKFEECGLLLSELPLNEARLVIAALGTLFSE